MFSPCCRPPLPLLASLSTWVSDHTVPLAGAAVVLVGLFVLGLTDVRRFHWGRVWAISGVCFAESIRRKVLWLVPLAILGLVAVVQLQQPSDEQDAIRQTTKFCLFASGLVVVLSTLILACTNLPREIENRVIFTVVTKPTTRLEIVLGKVVGFARVSFTILLFMGLFTWGYLHLRANLLTADLKYRLDHGAVEKVSIPTFEHYVGAGLLNAKSLADPESINIYGRPPTAGSHRRYLNPDGYLLAPLALPANLLAFTENAGQRFQDVPGMRLTLRVGYDPAPAPATKPGDPPAKPAADAGKPPQIGVQVFDANVNAALSGQQVAGGPVTLPADGSSKQAVVVNVPMSSVAQLRPFPIVYIAISPASGTQPLWVEEDPADLPVQADVPVVDPDGQVRQPRHLTPLNLYNPSQPGRLTFTGRQGTFGQQIRGDPTAGSQTCVFEFRGLHVSVPAGASTVPVEMRVGIEKNSDATVQEIPTDLRLTVHEPGDAGPGTGRAVDLPVVHPENNRTLYAALPADLARSGNFDVSARCLSPDQWVGFKQDSMSVVAADSSFGLNLTKSMAVLWLLSVLVTAVSVFSSTFLSWPTAVVFTLVLLLGRWGLNELGDAAAAGLGRQFVSDFGVRDPAISQTVAGSVDKLNSLFKTVAVVLPDISSFSATDDIDRGVSIPARTLGDAALTLLGFGVPLTVAAYIILKNKEVAP